VAYLCRSVSSVVVKAGSTSGGLSRVSWSIASFGGPGAARHPGAGDNYGVDGGMLRVRPERGGKVRTPLRGGTGARNWTDPAAGPGPASSSRQGRWRDSQ
jgi:hypothetical protein